MNGFLDRARNPGAEDDVNLRIICVKVVQAMTMISATGDM